MPVFLCVSRAERKLPHLVGREAAYSPDGKQRRQMGAAAFAGREAAPADGSRGIRRTGTKVCFRRDCRVGQTDFREEVRA